MLIISLKTRWIKTKIRFIHSKVDEMNYLNT